VPPRDDAEWQTVEVLEPLQEHGAVDLVEDVLADRNVQVGTDTEDVPVEGGMVQLAQGHAVRDHGLATIGITDAVGSLHQIGAPQAADWLYIGPTVQAACWRSSRLTTSMTERSPSMR